LQSVQITVSAHCWEGATQYRDSPAGRAADAEQPGAPSRYDNSHSEHQPAGSHIYTHTHAHTHTRSHTYKHGHTNTHSHVCASLPLVDSCAERGLGGSVEGHYPYLSDQIRDNTVFT